MSDWQERLRDSADRQESRGRADAERAGHTLPEVEAFYADVVIPAFEELRDLLRRYGRQVDVRPMTGYSSGRSATIEVLRGDTTELELSVNVEGDSEGSRASALWTRTDWQDGQRSSFKDNPFEKDSFFTSLSDITKEQIVGRFMEEYMPIFEQSGKTR